MRLWATRAWFQEAEADYGKAIELDPTNPAVYYNLGTLKRRQSRWVEAASAFLQANQNAPGNFHALAMTGLANSYTKLNRHAGAHLFASFAESVQTRCNQEHAYARDTIV